jgi:hypothetical protein
MTRLQMRIDIRKHVVERIVFSPGKFLPRELNITKFLMQKYPDLDFWKTYRLDKQIFSMNWFLCPEGEAKIKNDYAMFKYVPPAKVVYKLDGVKHGEDIVIPRRPKTLQELFKN